MRFIKKLLKYVTAASLATSTGWACHQIYTNKDVLSNSLDISVVSMAEDVEQNNNKDLIATSPQNSDQALSYTYDVIKFNLAKRLLKLAQNDIQIIRTGAIRGLSKINLQDWQYEILADMIDAQTAASLARYNNVNLKWFKEPPYSDVHLTRDELIERMKGFLSQLYENSKHSCLGYFISQAFAEFHEQAHDSETATMELKKFIQSARDVLFLSLESLLHHSSLDKYRKDIIEFNGLPLLMEIYQQYKGSFNVEALLCSIIANLTSQQDVCEQLFRTGWIRVMAKWIQEESDLKITLPTAKALANLDQDEPYKFRSRVYLLHPIFRLRDNYDADIVFIHGLLGGVFFTWRQREKKLMAPLGKGEQKKHHDAFSYDAAYPSCPQKFDLTESLSDQEFSNFMEHYQSHFNEWRNEDFEFVMEDLPIDSHGDSDGPFVIPSSHCPPPNEEKPTCFTYCWPKDWLSEDFKGLRIIGVNYDTSLSMWAPMCPSEQVKTLDQRSDELVKQLREAGIGDRPVIWICHSMGGLLVKKLLLKSFNSIEENIKNISLNTKGIVFYSTPHFGSSLAKLNPAIALLFWPSIEVQEMQENCPRLVQIHQDFIDLIEEIPLKIVSFVETKPTVVSAMKFGFVLVDKASGNPGVGEYYEIPTDHLQICKPSSKCSFLYQKVYQLIDDVIYQNNRQI